VLRHPLPWKFGKISPRGGIFTRERGRPRFVEFLAKKEGLNTQGNWAKRKRGNFTSQMAVETLDLMD